MNANLPSGTGVLPTTARPLIVEVKSPLEPEIVSHEIVEPGTTVAEHLKRYDLVSSPKLVIYNTKPLLEEDWETTYLNNSDQLTLISEPGVIVIAPWVIWAIVGVVAAVAAYSLYMVLTMDSPDPGERGDSPNYSVGYRGNRRRPGQPMPVVYGEIKVYPDLGGQFKSFPDNEQMLTQIFDITLGEIEPIDASTIFYEDTPLSSFDEYEFEHVQPGQRSELFPQDVHISSEVQDIELKVGGQWTVPYVTNPPGTEVTRIVLTFAFPNGLYGVDDKGRRTGKTAIITYQWREIDDLGNPIGDWEEKVKRYKNGKWKYARRWDVTRHVTAGRYEVRVKRFRNLVTSLDVSNSFVWMGLQAFSPSGDTTPTTRLAIIIRASERLGNASLSQLSVVVKRKIPIWNGSAWSLPAHTRSAAMAFADVCRSDYGGQLEDEYLDLDKLLELDATGIEFNGVYDSKNTMWTALNDIARPFNGRAIQRAGGIYSIKRDLPDQVPKMMFTMRNIIKDSFGIHHSLPINEKVNFVRVTFKNKLEDYRDTSIDCVPTGVSPIDPQEVTIRGVTDEQHAYDIGIRMARESLYRRRRISFKTGLEGLVVEYMDTILIAHYMLGLEQTVPCISGEIKSDTGYQTLNIWEDLTPLLSEANPKVYLMDVDGSPFGPVSCTIPDEHTIVLDSPAPSGIFIYSDDHAGPRFSIGRANDFMLEAKVTRMTQSGEHEVTIEAVEDSPLVYDVEAPPGYTPIEPPEDSSPIVDDLRAAIYGTTDNKLYVDVNWRGINCDYYLVDMSVDDQATWEEMDRPRDPFSSFDIPLIESIYVRVRGVNLFIGQPKIVILNPFDRTYAFPGVYNLRPLYPFNGPKVGVAWNQLQTGYKARIKFIHNATVVKQIDVDESVSFAEITDDEVMAVLGQTTLGQPFPASGTRFSTVRMHGLVRDENDVWQEAVEYTELQQTNDPMGDLQNLQVDVVGTTLNVDFQWPEAHGGFVFVFASLTPNFTVGEENLIHFGDSNTFAIVNKLIHPGTGNPNTYYIQIAGCDSWGPDSLSLMPEFSIETEDTWPPITEEMLDPSLGDRIDLIDRDPADPGGLVGLVNVNITNISDNRTDIDNIMLGYTGGVLQVPYGGTGVTTATGTGSTVRSDSPTFTGAVNAPTPASLAENSTIIATTEWVQSQGYSSDPGLGDLPGRVDTLESHFGGADPWVLEIVHGGTGATTATGSGSVVLQGSPHLTAPTADSPLTADNSTRVATTEWVKSQGYVFDPEVSDLPARVDMLESHFGGADPWILEVGHGGTGTTTSTGSGSVVLSNNPTVSLASGSTAVTQALSDSDTSIATTAFVKGQGYADDGDLTALEQRVTTNEQDIDTLEGEMDVVEGKVQTLEGEMDTAEADIDTLESYFIGGVLQVLHGGTGVTASTGTGKTVLSNSPTFTGNPQSVTPAVGDNDKSIATTEFVKLQDYSTNTDLSALTDRVTTNEGDIDNLQGRMGTAEGDIDVLEGYFVAGVLPVIHGGTGVTVSTGTGEVVLSNSPDFDGYPTSTTPTTSDSSTKIATTAFVKNQGYALDSDLGVIESYFIDGVLPVIHGGTGQTTSTGSGSVVLKNSPTFTGNPKSTHPPAADSDTSIATTQWVQGEISSQAFDPSGLQSQIDTNRTDLDVVEGHFVGGVLEVAHGGTGVTTKTGTGSVVLNSSPGLTGSPTAPTPSSSSDSTRIATTAWVKDRIPEIAPPYDDSAIWTQVNKNESDLDVIEGHFVGGVLEVVHGGTGVTTKTGSGSVVLSSSPTLSGSPKSSNPATSDSSTRIATTSFVHNLVNEERAAFPEVAYQGATHVIGTSYTNIGPLMQLTPTKTGAVIKYHFSWIPNGYSPGDRTYGRLLFNGVQEVTWLWWRNWDYTHCVDGGTYFLYFTAPSTSTMTFQLQGYNSGNTRTLGRLAIAIQEIDYSPESP